MLRQFERVKPIIEDALPGRDLVFPSAAMWSWWVPDHVAQIESAIGVLESRAEHAKRFGPEQPLIGPGQVHPLVWDAAKDLWANRHYTEAVHRAAKRINDQIQARVGRRDVSDVDLVNQTLSLSPPQTGKRRIRVIEDDGSDTYKSIQQGTMALGQAIFWLWRNVPAHELDGLSEVEALEALASMSAFVRLIERGVILE